MQGAWTWNEVPNLIAVERKKGAKEVVMVDGVMHLCGVERDVTEVNMLLYAGGVVGGGNEVEGWKW